MRITPDEVLCCLSLGEAQLLAGHLGDAYALAREYQAHCHRGLGMLYRGTGQQVQSRTELLAAIALYRVMDMTLWLPETEAALAEVQGGEERL